LNQITPTQAEPHSIEAEQQVLGLLMLDAQAWPEVGPILSPEDFFDPVHARIFDVMRDRFNKGHLVSPVTLNSVLESDEGVQQLGGSQYIANMAAASCSISFAKDYAKLIAERKQARDALSFIEEARSGISGGAEPQEAVARLQSSLMTLREVEGRETCVSFLKAGTDSIAETHEAYQGRLSLLKTGLTALDKVLRGLAPADLMLMGGATSMGKSAVGVDIAHRVAARGQVVGFASLEMEPTQLFARVTSSQSRVPYELARAADEMTEENFAQWVEAGKSAAELPIHVFPRHVRDVAAIQATAQGLKMRHKRLDLLIVDYAQLCRAPGREFRERMVNVSIGLKHMAKVLQCPVIALVQLDRNIGQRPDPRPHLSDIKETSQFETDADQIVFCHREAYFLERNGPARDKSGQVTDEARADWEADLRKYKNRLELIVKKNRHGRLAVAEVGCHMPTNRFWNLHEETEGFA
jgi:replicative DNA helicase